jgi:hypothetical protein
MKEQEKYTHHPHKEHKMYPRKPNTAENPARR